MSALKFADSHNMVAFLAKPTESEGFEQIFWATAKEKTVNGEVQIQAQVDGKKVIVTKASVRRDLQLADENGIKCLPNATIFAELERMSAKTTNLNEFSSTMASAVICLATNQKFNFSKYIFYNMVKNLEGGVKFLMYPRFVQVFLDKQVEEMSKHKEIYVTPSHTKKVFANMKRHGKDFSAMPIDPHHTPIIQPVKNMDSSVKFLMYPRFVQVFLDKQVGDMSTHDEIFVTPFHIKKVFGNMKRVGKGFFGAVTPLFPTMMVQAQQEQGEAEEAINEENIPTHSNDPLLSGEDRLKLEELMTLCTNLQNRVLDLEHTKTTQALEIDSLKRRVKKLEKKQRSRTHGHRRLYKVGLSARVISSKDEGVFNDEEVFAGKDMAEKEVSTADPVTTAGEVVTTANAEVSTASLTAATIITVELTLAQTLAELKSARPKTKGMKKKDQVLFDEQEAIRLQAQSDEEERIAREKEEVNAALIAQWTDIQDKVETDYELAQRLQAEAQEELTIKEKSKLFQQLLEKRRKHFATKRAEERRNKPPTKAQQRSIMTTYLKNMARWKPKDLKNKSFASVQELFEKVMKRVNTFVDMDTELVEGNEIREEESSSKRAGDELEQEPSKKQKMEDDKETAELQNGSHS
ncbi:hypothetical protein Tco_0829136 [Tanacetum coccineum]